MGIIIPNRLNYKEKKIGGKNEFMKKKSAIIMISITILTSLAGCRLTNIDDVYSMADIEDEKKTTVVVDNKESKWHDDNKYYTIPEGVDIPPMVNMDDTINETSNKNKLECKIEEAYVTNDFTDVYMRIVKA